MIIIPLIISTCFYENNNYGDNLTINLLELFFLSSFDSGRMSCLGLRNWKIKKREVAMIMVFSYSFKNVPWHNRSYYAA